MNFEEWYAKLGEWAEENTALNMSHAMQRHLARHLEEWEASRPTPRAADFASRQRGAARLPAPIKRIGKIAPSRNASRIAAKD